MKKLLITIFFLLMISSCAFGFMEINSKNAILIDSSNGRILYEKDANVAVKPASTTKIMTAILAFENLGLQDTATASQTAISSVPVDGSSAYIQVGETFTVEQLLECLLIVSGNDAANILAEKVGGTTDNFVNMMNAKATEIGCTSTHFVNANGLDNDNHNSSAHDLAIMYRYAYNLFPEFRRIMQIHSFTLPNTNIYQKEERKFTNTNRLMTDQPNSVGKDGFSYYYPACNGGKTGYTSGAKNCLVASASNGNVTLIACVLGGEQNLDGSSQRFKDTISLFDYGFQRIVKKELVSSRRINRFINRKR